MKQEHIKSYKKLLDKIRRNTYNIKKEDYQHFQELTKNNTVYSFFHFSNLLFQDKEKVRIRRKLNFSEDECNFLNNIAHSLFYYHEHYIDFEYKPKDEKELEETFKFLLENYN